MAFIHVKPWLPLYNLHTCVQNPLQPRSKFCCIAHARALHFPQRDPTHIWNHLNPKHFRLALGPLGSEVCAADKQQGRQEAPCGCVRDHQSGASENDQLGDWNSRQGREQEYSGTPSLGGFDPAKRPRSVQQSLIGVQSCTLPRGYLGRDSRCRQNDRALDRALPGKDSQRSLLQRGTVGEGCRRGPHQLVKTPAQRGAECSDQRAGKLEGHWGLRVVRFSAFGLYPRLSGFRVLGIRKQVALRHSGTTGIGSGLSTAAN